MSESKTPQKPKSAFREWLDSIVFAVVAATLIRFFFFEAYTIPTPSMEGSLMTGDFLFVSKLHYGVRSPKTPLQVPLTHQKIWGTNLPSYLDWIQLPFFRLPGFSSPKTGDPVVFNVPNYNADGDAPVDLRTYYIKRCIGTPGDTITIDDAQVKINGKALVNPTKMRHRYKVVTTAAIENDVFKANNIENGMTSMGEEISNINPAAGLLTKEDTALVVQAGGAGIYCYVINTDEFTIAELRKLPICKKAEMMIQPKGERSGPSGYAQNPEEVPIAGKMYNWNVDNYGPLVVPKEGMTIKLDSANIAKYRYAIKYYEGNKNVEITEGSVKIDGKAIGTYTFKQDYYFMMGDNRHNSDDSRFWGFVPFDHVVGKAVFVWMSLDPAKGLFDGKIRWNRIFRTID